MKMTIGERIKLERIKRHISQRELADILGWNHHQMVLYVEKNKREVKVHELNKIAKRFGMSLHDFFEEPKKDAFVLWCKGI